MTEELSSRTKTLNKIRRIFIPSFMERLLLLFTMNKKYDSFFVRLIPNNYQYAPNTFRFIKRNGISYKVDLYDYIGWWLYFGIRELSRQKMYNLIHKSDVVIDVGANIGETVLNFAKQTGSQGEIHAFEPDSLNYKRCIENISLNTLKNIYLNNVGLGS